MPHNRTILVIEDDLAIQDLVVDALSEEGYYVQAVANAAGARIAVDEQAWDLLLTDLWLPDTTGLDFAHELRRIGRNLPILLMTADPQVHSFDLSDIAFCLVKPFDLDVLLDCVASHLPSRAE